MGFIGLDSGVLSRSLYALTDGDMSLEDKLLYAFDWRQMTVDFGASVLLFFLLGGGKGGNKSGKLTIVEDGTYSSSERNAAQYMADMGNDVVLRPPTRTRAGGGTSDLLVNGINYDVYTPKTNNPSAIIRAITKKNTQAIGIVLDLSDTTVTEAELGNILARVKGAIEKNGGICNIKDIVVMPK